MKAAGNWQTICFLACIISITTTSKELSFLKKFWMVSNILRPILQSLWKEGEQKKGQNYSKENKSLIVYIHLKNTAEELLFLNMFPQMF